MLSPSSTSSFLCSTGLVSSPTPCTLIVTRSPAVSGPIPDGVPVVMMSPGSSVITAEMNAMSFGTGKISSRVDDDCRRVPLTQPSTVSPSAESYPRPVAMQGPMGANVSKPLARVYCTSFACSSRAVTSLTQVIPNTYRDASSSRTATRAIR